MATKIQWTNETSNPIYLKREDGSNGGHWCKKISEGCVACYAETINNNNRFPFASHLPYAGAKPNTLTLDKSILISWVKARKTKLIFPFSMTDWCGDWVSMEWSMNILDSMAASRLTFQTLTKRAERLNEVCYRWFETRKLDRMPPNIWLGISAENQARFDERIDYLIDIPCDIRWLSLEPLLGEINLSSYIDRVQWIVVGGESGKSARECYLEWLDKIVDQCQDKAFVKQLGSNPVYCDCLGNVHQYATKHSKGGDIDEFPPSLRIRNFPIAA